MPQKTYPSLEAEIQTFSVIKAFIFSTVADTTLLTVITDAGGSVAVGTEPTNIWNATVKRDLLSPSGKRENPDGRMGTLSGSPPARTMFMEVLSTGAKIKKEPVGSVRHSCSSSMLVLLFESELCNHPRTLVGQFQIRIQLLEREKSVERKMKRFRAWIMVNTLWYLI